MLVGRFASHGPSLVGRAEPLVGDIMFGTHPM